MLWHFTRKINERQTCYQNLNIFNPDVFNTGITTVKKREKWGREEQRFKLVTAHGSFGKRDENNLN